MHDIVQILHLLHDQAVKPQGGKLIRIAVLNRAVHLRPVVDRRPVGILRLVLMEQRMNFLSVHLQGHARVEHIQFDRASGTLDQQIVLRPVECRSPLQNRITVIGEFHIDKDHIVLIAELLASVSHVVRIHIYRLRHAAHDELHTVQLMNVMIQMSAGLFPYLLPGYGGLYILPSVSG